MGSTFFGFEVGYRALQTQQKAIEVTSNNLANAGTPGYSRQNVEIAATDPYTYPSFVRNGQPGQLGTGVEVKAIVRERNGLIDAQIRNETAIKGQWESRSDYLAQMETIMNEPSDTGVRESLDRFWASLQELSSKPEEQSTRSAVRQQGFALADQIKHNYSQLKELRSNVNEQIETQVATINSYASQIAEINDQIGKITIGGDHPNDLLDKRDDLLEKLSKFVNVSVATDKFERVTVTVNGKPLVHGGSYTAIRPIPVASDDNMAKLYWSDTNTPVQLNTGSLQGLLELRDRDLPQMMQHMNNFAGTMIQRTNELHRGGRGLDGSTKLNFFSGSTAEDIGIADEIQNDLNKIAASATGAPGDGQVALEMAKLKQEKILSDHSTTMSDYLGGVISKLGIESQMAKTKSDNQDLLIKNLDDKREGFSGVSLDEEMTNLVKYQQSYNAAAKIVTTMNDMLDVIVNRLKVS